MATAVKGRSGANSQRICQHCACLFVLKQQKGKEKFGEGHLTCSWFSLDFAIVFAEYHTGDTDIQETEEKAKPAVMHAPSQLHLVSIGPEHTTVPFECQATTGSCATYFCCCLVCTCVAEWGGGQACS